MNASCGDRRHVKRHFAMARVTPFILTVVGLVASLGLSGFAVQAAVPNASSGGPADILWRQSGGTTAAWLTSQGQVVQSGILGAPPANWSIAAQRDFNGDGNADILWRDSATGSVAIWLLNGVHVLQTGIIGALPSTWSIIGTSDFNGDGRGDILWRDTATGTVAIWLVNGLQVIRTGTLGPVPDTWVLAATDGAGRIFWRDRATGAVVLWVVSGLQVTQNLNVGAAPGSWVIVDTGDFNGDGSTDLLWRDTATGIVAIWLLNGAQIVQAGTLGPVPRNWVIARAGDFDGNNKSDILWRDTTTGTVGVWFMNGVQIASTATLAVVPLDWTIQGPPASIPAFVGQWAPPMAWPIVAVHASLLPTGEVLISDGQWLGNDARIWTPATNTFTSVVNDTTNLFCSAHCHLADGRVLFAGGHVGAHSGVTDTNLFDATTRAWTLVGAMTTARWYPSVTTLPDGRVLVTAGEMGCADCDAPLPEVYDPQANTWTELSGASLALPYYPHMHVLPDGRVLASSTTEHPIMSQILDVDAQTWTVVDPDPVDGGSAVMYVPGKILKTGTSYHPDDPVVPSAATSYVLDATQPSPRWRQTASMAYARTYHVLTALPDGSVLVTGGGVTTDAVGVDGAALAAELWSPTTETWTTMASMRAPRLYHSTALLMPDGRVLVMGGGRFNGVDEPTDQLSAEFYSPPYLFRGARPTITSAPPTMTYGSTIAVATPDAGRIASIALIRLGSVTHAINMDQRLVPLGFTAGGNSLAVRTPANANLAPPGFYMLFILDGNGVPSVAATLRLQ
jgi:Domain of unknown function (DUF1929)/FG-GAP-like repeat